MKNSRKHYTPEEKVAILRRHLLEKEPISTLCDELGLQPTVFYRWQKEFFENGDYYRSGTASRRRRARALSSLWRLISIGTSTFIHQHQRDVLLPVQHSGRLQPIHRQVGSAG